MRATLHPGLPSIFLRSQCQCVPVFRVPHADPSPLGMESLLHELSEGQIVSLLILVCARESCYVFVAFILFMLEGNYLSGKVMMVIQGVHSKVSPRKCQRHIWREGASQWYHSNYARPTPAVSSFPEPAHTVIKVQHVLANPVFALGYHYDKLYLVRWHRTT